MLALFCLLGPAVTPPPMLSKAIGGVRWKWNQRLGYVALAFVVVHLIFLGAEAWLVPSGWHAGIPPIGLVAGVVALVPLAVKRKWNRNRAEKAGP